MSYLIKSSLVAVFSLTFMASEASAQYYAPTPAPQSNGHYPGGLGLDLGLRDYGFNPNAAVGIGPIGAGVGAGVGQHGLGLGANTGVGPLGASADAGLGRNGLGARGSAGIGKTTGAAFNGGISGDGIGVGASAKVLNFGAGASLGIGNRGPGLGASLGFGPLGTLLIGSHRNSYPGAQTAANTIPNQRASYYTQQNYGNAPYYRPAPMQHPNYRQHRNYARAVAVQPHQNIHYSQQAPSAYRPAPYGTATSAPSACPARWTC